jgi:hypothetical protein
MQNPQMFTVFGGSFISEEHAALSTKEKSSFGTVAKVVAALVLGTTISASAVAGLRHGQAAYSYGGSPFFSSNQLGIGFQTALW